jgi:hypothetical protein
VNQGRLYADCRDTRGRVRETSIELARCSSSDIGNDDGLLVCHGHRGSFEDRPDSGGGDGSWGGGPSVTFFADSDFRGQSFVVTGETAFLAGFNDRASSARVNGSWEVCEDTRFGGRCERIDRDVRNFSEFGLNDRISSVRQARGGGGGWGGGGGVPGGRNTITVFRDANYTGGLHRRQFLGTVRSVRRGCAQSLKLPWLQRPNLVAAAAAGSLVGHSVSTILPTWAPASSRMWAS